MQTNPNQKTYSGLVSILGLATIIIGLIIMILLPDIKLASWGIMGVGVALLAVALILDFRRVKGAVTGRRGRFGAGTTVMAAVFVGIIVFANAISIANFHRFDVTGLAQFTLTEKTKSVLKELSTPVDVICFFTPTDTTGVGGYALSLLNEYKNFTDNLNIRVIDPDEHPDQAKKYGIYEYQTIVFESQQHQRHVTAYEVQDAAENAFTGAILEVTGIVQKKVYFLVGQDEHNIQSTDASGYDNVRRNLMNNLYQVDVLDLISTPKIPDDCAALIIAGPQKEMTPDELNIIKNYLDNGGWVMYLAGPNPPADLTQVFAKWGVDIQEGTVIDPASYAAPNKDNPSVPRTRNFFGLNITYFPGSTAIIPSDNASEYLDIRPMAWTTPDSWLEKDFAPDKESVFNEGVDTKGPLALGTLIITTIPEEQQDNPPDLPDTRIIIFGDSDFISNQNFYNGNNGDLFLNSVNLLTTGKEMVSIDRKVLPFRRMVISPSVQTFITYSSIALVPALMLVIGGIIWWQRR